MWTEIFIYLILYRKINSLEAIANSGILSDREIELEHGREVLIPETKRLQDYSISAKIDRFSKQMESMYDL
jgi:hypothetical protein